ncbi:MAG: hypothetical protein L0H53_07670 [Candidatus Nitrosocosmicus sp.]|nr:hypothetical protein [Candidatus Nitrosocosmicus sp.]MDN5867145.1 hypothetical protein [Candidatus Nitrosocosmicus sp.]
MKINSMEGIRKITSEVLVSAALALLVIYILDVGVSMLSDSEGFLPLSAKDRGMIFGGGSILLFIISFGIGINVASRLLTVLLIIGGAIMGTTVLISSFIAPTQDSVSTNSSSDSGQSQILAPQFIGIIVIGYIIMGMGIFRALRKK